MKLLVDPPSPRVRNMKTMKVSTQHYLACSLCSSALLFCSSSILCCSSSLCLLASSSACLLASSSLLDYVQDIPILVIFQSCMRLAFILHMPLD